MATQLKQAAPGLAEGFHDEDVDDLIAKVRAARPILMAHADEGEAKRSPAAASVAVLDEIGLWNMLVPKRWGGRGMSTTAFSRVQAEVAKGDPSISWVNQIINGTTWISTLTSDEFQEAVFGPEPTLICGSYNPPGKAVKVEGGYIVNGAWPYGSGSRQAQWVQCGVLLEKSDGPVVPGINMAYIPIEEIEIVDSWYVTGMQGTGSDTLIAKDVFVPDSRFVSTAKPYGTVYPGMRHHGAPSDYLPVVPVVRSTGIAQLIGAGQMMLELLTETAQKRGIVTTTYAKMSEAPVVQHHLGEVTAKLDAAWLLCMETCRVLDGLALSHTKIEPATAARLKAQSALAVDILLQAVERIMTIAGSSAFARSNPLQRYWRDINMAARHVSNLPHVGYEILGKEIFGIAPNITPPGAF